MNLQSFFRRKVHKHAPHYHVVINPSTDRVLLHTVHDEERWATRDLGDHFSAEMPLADPEPPAHHLVRDDHEDATLIVRTVNRRYGCYPGYAYGEAPLGKPHDTHLDFAQNPEIRGYLTFKESIQRSIQKVTLAVRMVSES